MTAAPVTSSPVEIHLLGAINVDVGGRPLADLLAQPKRLALVTYLLLRRADGFVHRSELLSLFWPESTEERARASLRQALRFLRVQLGEAVIVGRGDAEVGIERSLVSCDVLHVLRALASGDERAAYAAFTGELMPGFSLPELPDFDDWLDTERLRLHNAMVKIAFTLADHAAHRGEHEAASGYLRRVLEWEPNNDSAAAKLKAASSSREKPDAQRVLVVQLENCTGDENLALVGMLATETLAQGLAWLADLDVAPPVPRFGADIDELAIRYGAGTVISGSYYLDGERLVLQARITDVASGKLIPAPEPIAGFKSTPIEAIAEFRDAVVRAIAPALSRRVRHARHAMRPPSLAAYAAYADGLEFFVRGDWRSALEFFERSASLEPNYALPRIVAAITLWNLGELQRARTAANEAARASPELPRFERAVLDMVQAWLNGDWAAAYRAARIQADLAPSSIPHFAVAEELRRMNRLREARAVLQEIDPQSGELHGFIFYWIELTVVHHLLGDHRQELELANRCRQLYPDSAMPALLQARALAALGQDDALDDVVNQLLAFPGSPEAGAGVMYEASLELRAHGYTAPADALMARAATWYEELLAGDAGEALQRAAATAYYHAGRLEEARALFTALQAAGPVRQFHGVHHGQLQAQLDEGYLAVLAVRLGDQEARARWSAALRDMDRPFLYGAQWYWLACLAALEERKDDAVRMLRRAFADGLAFEMFLHTDPHLRNLRGYAPFDLLMRSRD